MSHHISLPPKRLYFRRVLHLYCRLYCRLYCTLPSQVLRIWTVVKGLH
jgi:hypothetical protein